MRPPTASSAPSSPASSESADDRPVSIATGEPVEEPATHFRVDIGPGLVRVHGVCDTTTAPTVCEAIALAAAPFGTTLIRVELADVEMLSAGATRFLEQGVLAARAYGGEVRLIAPAGCVAHRVLTAIRALLGQRADRLPIETVPATRVLSIAPETSKTDR